MKKLRSLKKYALFFVAGAIGYGLLEIVWRGRTHWSMLIAGGICLVIFSVVAEKASARPLVVKAAICAACVTLVELAFGLVFNVALKMNVWDYSAMPLNLLGQICPLFSLLWCALALVLLPPVAAVNKKLSRDAPPVRG